MSIVQNFDREVLAASHTKPIVVQFYADWCGPCQVLKPLMQKIAGEANGEWEFKLVDIDKDRNLASSLGIRSIPTLMMFYKNDIVARMAGSKTEYIIKNWLDEHLPKQNTPIQSGEHELIEMALKEGNLSKAKDLIIDTLLKQDSDNVLLKLLRAIENVGTNNKSSRSWIEQLERNSPFGTIIKKVRDLIDIDEDEKDAHTPTSSPVSNSTVDIQSKVDIRNIDFNLLNELVHRGINEVRASKGVASLEPNSILEASANDQNVYMIQSDKLTHYQNSPHKKTVKDRVLSFGGNGFRTMGENVQYKGYPVRTSGRYREVITDSYHKTAVDLVMNWVNSPGHYKNLISPNFKYVGTAVGWNPENSALFATQVFGA